MTPKTNIVGFVRYLAISAVISLFSLSALAQISLPDYSKWASKTSFVNAIHNDKSVFLRFDHYLNNTEKEKSLYVNVLNNENGEPWIAFHAIAYLGQSERNEFHFFEYKDKKWEYVKNFSDSQDLSKDTTEFLKVKYNFSFQ